MRNPYGKIFAIKGLESITVSTIYSESLMTVELMNMFSCNVLRMTHVGVTVYVTNLKVQ